MGESVSGDGDVSETVIPPVGFTLKQRRKALQRFLKSVNYYEQPKPPRVEARPQED